jgi:hypothetical protein
MSERGREQKRQQMKVSDLIPEDERDMLMIVELADGRSDEIERIAREVDWYEVHRLYWLKRGREWDPKLMNTP